MDSPVKEGDLARELYAGIDAALKSFQYELMNKLTRGKGQVGTARVYASNAIARAIAYAATVAATNSISPEPETRGKHPPTDYPDSN